MLSEIKQFFKGNKQNVLLAVLVFLLALLAFGAGMVVEFYLQKPAIQIEQN